MVDLIANVSCEMQANAYVPNWGQIIFQSANEMMNNEVYRQRMSEQQDKLAEEREWWNKKKASIQEGFMKELDEGSSEPAAAQTATAPKPSEPAPSAAPAAVVQGSDDDAVLVEADPSGNSTAGSPSGKKKKGKGKK